MLDFLDWDINPAGDAPAPEVPLPDAPAPEFPGGASAADAFFTYRPQVTQMFGSELNSQELLNSPLFADTSTSTSEGVKGGTTTVNTGGSIFESMRRFLNLPDTEAGRRDAANLTVAAGVTAGGAILQGIGSGVTNARNRKLAEQKLAIEKGVADSQIALNNSKAHNLVPGSVAQPGLINAFAPAKYVPVTKRTA